MVNAEWCLVDGILNGRYGEGYKMTKQDNKLFMQTTCQPAITFVSPDAEFKVSQICSWDYDVDEDGNVINLHLNGVNVEMVGDKL